LELDELDDGERYFKLALERNLQANIQPNVGDNYMKLGLLAMKSKKYSDGENYFHKALKSFRECHSVQLIAESLVNSGLVAMHEANYQQAVNHFKQVLKFLLDLTISITKESPIITWVVFHFISKIMMRA
jgi:tetratricopeptide (TPR) repeat protein